MHISLCTMHISIISGLLLVWPMMILVWFQSGLPFIAFLSLAIWGSQ